MYQQKLYPENRIRKRKHILRPFSFQNAVFPENLFGFIPEHIQAVKDSICLFSSVNCRYYGKTGTRRIDGKDVNGWFVGFVETTDNTYFFATNIQGNRNASDNKPGNSQYSDFCPVLRLSQGNNTHFIYCFLID